MRTWTTALIIASLLGTTAAAHAGWDEGVAALKAKNYADAAREFQAVTEQHTQWPDGYFMLGQSLMKLNRKQDALNAFRQAYDLNPNEVRYQLKLGEAYVQGNRFQDAVQLLSKVDEGALNSSQRSALNQLMAVASAKGGGGDPLVYLKKAAQTNPNDASAQYNYGAAAFNAGRTSEAVGALEKAVSIDGSDAAKRKAYIDALMRQGRESRGTAKVAVYTKAVTAAKVLIQNQATFNNFLTLGEAQLGAGAYQDAVTSFNQAAAKKSSDWIPQFYIGQAYTATKQYANAETALQKSLTVATGGNRNRVLKQLGFVFEKLKRYDDAIASYNEAGDSAGVARAQENATIADHNKEADAEQREYQDLKRQEEDLKRQMEELGQASPPPGW